VKAAQMSLAVYRRAAAVKPVIFVDKSGSMAEAFSGEDVAKISVAAGLALALYCKYKATVYLFDTETERVTPREVVETLLRIKADGGTNISSVMEEVMKIDNPNQICLIISDGITDAPQELTNRFVNQCGARTWLILIPPSSENYRWVQELKKRNHVIYARDVAQFEEAARRIFARTS
jgi:uncharacterized protein with von Willebrand factor type A (vWA) domain